MAKKSKTQRAKASAARAARKEQARQAEAAAADAKSVAEANAETDAPKRSFLKKAPKGEASVNDGKQAAGSIKSITQRFQKSEKVEKAPEKKPARKSRFAFLKDVRAELKRVTWPTKQDVFRWSVVVVVALVFFGVYVAVLDNVVVTPILVAFSSLGLNI